MKLSLSKDDEAQAILSVQHYFREEFDLEISDLKAKPARELITV